MKRFLLTLAALTLCGCSAVIGADTAEAESYAQEFVAKNFPQANVQNLECQNADSDGDGYVSCTVSLKEGAKTRLQAIECAGTYFWQLKWSQTGCRVPKVGQ
jgi:flagellar basal body-associated protein FliL